MSASTASPTRPKLAYIFANFPAKLAQFHDKGAVLVGDVHPGVVEVAGAMTPVPGGVGPLTIAMLMSNTVKARRPAAPRARTSAPATPAGLPVLPVRQAGGRPGI